MNHFIKTLLHRVGGQALVGVVVAFTAYLFGLLLCDFIPCAGVKYVNPLGECLVGATIFLASLSLWLKAHFRTVALFLTGGFLAGLVVVVFFVFGGGIKLLSNGFAYAHWGMVRDLLLVWRHTAVPVLCAAVTLQVINSVRSQAHDLEGGVENDKVPKSTNSGKTLV